MSDTHELAWAAGFFDGEGSTSAPCGTRQSGRQAGQSYRQVKVQVSQNDTAVLERFRDAVGVGSIYGPYTQAAPTRKPVWHFSAQGVEDAQLIIWQLWPWLGGIKRQQAEAAFEKYTRML
jgi:hypothetical protein